MIDPANPRCEGAGPHGTHVFVHGLDQVVPAGTRKTPSEPKLTDRCQCGQYSYEQLRTGRAPVVVSERA